MNAKARFAAIGAVSMLVIAGCSSQQSTSSAPSTSSTPTASTKIVVFAAAAQKKAFSEIGERFSTDNPGGNVEFSFASSADHAAQLTQGAYADVFASRN